MIILSNEIRLTNQIKRNVGRYVLYILAPVVP